MQNRCTQIYQNFQSIASINGGENTLSWFQLGEGMKMASGYVGILLQDAISALFNNVVGNANIGPWPVHPMPCAQCRSLIFQVLHSEER